MVSAQRTVSGRMGVSKGFFKKVLELFSLQWQPLDSSCLEEESAL